MCLFDAGDTFPIFPPMIFGFATQVAGLDQVVLDHEQQSASHFANVREVHKHHQCHELELLPIRVLVVARFIVHHASCQVVIVNDEQVGNAAHPDIFVHESARAQIGSDAHLVLAQLATGLGLENVECVLDERKLRGQRLAVLDVQLSRCVQLLAVDRCFGVLERVALEHLHFVVAARAALVIFERGV